MTVPGNRRPVPGDADARRSWARCLIRRAPDAPAYGTPAWLALPDGPEKVAAVVRAAECWARDGDELEDRLRAELAAVAPLIAKYDEDAAWAARGSTHRRSFYVRDRSGVLLVGFHSTPAQKAAVAAEWEAWVNGDDAA